MGVEQTVPSPGVSHSKTLRLPTSGFGAQSCRARNRAQDEQRVLRAGNDRVSLSSIVAEFDERGRVVERLDDRADLSANEPVLWQIAQQRHRAQHRGAIAIDRLSRHHRTQQVTKRGTASPFLTREPALSIRDVPMDQRIDKRLIGDAFLERAGL